MTNVPAHIVVHCSASEWGSAAVIDEWHRERGFLRDLEDLGPGELKHVGYHYVIENGLPKNSRTYERKSDGLIVPCRRETERGAHAKGWNHRSVGVCLIGNGAYSPNQLSTLYGLLLGLMRRWSIPVSRVIGHCEFDSGKTCPVLSMDELRASLTLIEATLPKEARE